jgi:hypothetical protein
VTVVWKLSYQRRRREPVFLIDSNRDVKNKEDEPMSASTLKPASVPVRTPYESDPYSWAREQARALREKRAEQLDWDNLAEEVEDLADRHADALEGHCENLIEHLLELSYAAELIRRDNLRLWRASVRNARHRIATLLKRNPGLNSRAHELFAEAWPLGRNQALGKLDLDDAAIPERQLWSFEQAIDGKFEPEGQPETNS